eukprot:2628050-Pyramimonas_sp.AAC.1
MCYIFDGRANTEHVQRDRQRLRRRGQYSTVQSGLVQCSPVQYSTAQHSTAQHSTVRAASKGRTRTKEMATAEVARMNASAVTLKARFAATYSCEFAKPAVNSPSQQ